MKNLERIRLTLELTQREFAKKLNTSQGTIDALEKCRRKKIPLKIKKKLNLITKDIDLIDHSELKKRKEALKVRGRFFGARAKIMAARGGSKGAITTITKRQPTLQEKKVAEILRKNNIDYELNAPIKLKNRNFVIDFVIPNRKKPEIFIEVKGLKSDYRKYLSCVELAWRIIKLKQEYPKSRFFVWIEGDLIDSETKIIKEEATRFFVNEEINQLMKYLKLE